MSKDGKIYKELKAKKKKIVEMVKASGHPNFPDGTIILKSKLHNVYTGDIEATDEKPIELEAIQKKIDALQVLIDGYEEMKKDFNDITNDVKVNF